MLVYCVKLEQWKDPVIFDNIEDATKLIEFLLSQVVYTEYGIKDKLEVRVWMEERK